MSDTNRVAIRVAKETVYGDLPTASYNPVPFTGSTDLGSTPETVQSAIIRSDRQISDLALVNQSVGGGFDTELAQGDAFDTLLEGVLFSDAAFSAAAENTPTGNIIAVINNTGAPGVIVMTSVEADWAGLVVGDLVRYTETASGKSIVGPVLDISTVQLIIAGGDGSGDGAAVEGFAQSVANGGFTFEKLPQITNGTTQSSFAIERTYREGEAGGEFFEYLTGLVPGTFSFAAEASSIVTATFGFTGKSQRFATNAEGRDSAVTAVDQASYSVYNAAANVATMTLGGSSQITNLVTGINVDVENNLRERSALGYTGAASVGAGEFMVTGGLNTYFFDPSTLALLANNEETSLTVAFAAGADTIMFHFPRIKFTEGLPEVSGANEDVTANLSWQALADDTAGYTMAIAKVTA
jgi:hypothetical protein